jgi:hypothetical protein
MQTAKTLFWIFIAMATAFSVEAQRFNKPKTESPDFGIFAGASSFNGDLTFNPLQRQDFHPSVGVYYRLPVSPKIAFRLGFNYGTISGADSLAKGNTWRLHRNLSFKSPIYDFHIYGEYTPIRLYRGRYNYFAPYIFGGLAYFKFNPMAQYRGHWYNLQPFGTEGQGLPGYPSRKPYKLSGVSTPIGGGLRYKFAGRWQIGLEVVYNKTYSDYLDDVSSTYVPVEDILAGPGPNRVVAAALADRSIEVVHDARKPGSSRGNDKRTDSYVFTGITIGYSFLKHDKCFSF